MAVVLVSFSSFLQVCTLQLTLSIFYDLCFHAVCMLRTLPLFLSVLVPLTLSRKSLSTVDSALVFRFN